MKKLGSAVLLILCMAMVICISAQATAPVFHDKKIEITFIDSRGQATEAPAPEATPVPKPKADLSDVQNLEKAQVGEIVEFGRDEDDAPALWVVTDVQDGGSVRTLELLSVYITACKQYHNHYAKTTWEKCKLRQELNKGGYGTGIRLNSDEESYLMEKENLDSPGTVSDKIWIPDLKEYKRLKPILESVLRGFTKDEESFRKVVNGMDGWWLRGTGDKSVRVFYVTGECGEVVEETVNAYAGVRPMIRLAVKLP